MQIAPEILESIRQRGPLSSLDIKNDQSIDWLWGVETRLPRAALELLYFMGEVGIHHRVNTRRIFDLNERLLPPELLNSPDPNPTFESYQQWHVFRRVGGLGIANPGGTEHWLDILDRFMNRFGISLVCLGECILIGWVFGSGKIKEYVNGISEFRIGVWWDFLIRFLIPIVLGFLIIAELLERIQGSYSGYPRLAEFLGGWMMILLLPVFGIILMLVKRRE